MTDRAAEHSVWLLDLNACRGAIHPRFANGGTCTRIFHHSIEESWRTSQDHTSNECGYLDSLNGASIKSERHAASQCAEVASAITRLGQRFRRGGLPIENITEQPEHQADQEHHCGNPNGAARDAIY